jgi:sulfate transport system ATP-binding protein
VTHDQEEALEVADRVVLMDKGRIEQVGTPEEVYNHPATPFVYGFLGSVNLFHGRVDEGNLKVGEETVPGAAADFAQGAEVYAFARPHELEIITDPASTAGLGARVVRVLSFGVSSRVELDGTGSAEGQHFEVELAQPEVQKLALIQGQSVRLLPSRLKLFERAEQIKGQR